MFERVTDTSVKVANYISASDWKMRMEGSPSQSVGNLCLMREKKNMAPPHCGLNVQYFGTWVSLKREPLIKVE